MTLVTSGLIGRDSSASADLQRSLESRLMTRLDTAGSTLFKLTWKGRNTPLGRRYLERAVSVRRTSANGCTSWPTPQSHDSAGIRTEEQYAKGKLRGHGQANLNDMAAMVAGWPTPMVTNREDDIEKRVIRGKKYGFGPALTPILAANLSAWPTPAQRDYKSESATEEFNDLRWEHKRGKPLSAEVSLTVSGKERIGYSARDGIVKIGNGAQLNPEHSRWLQALPTVFSSCADTAMQSVRKSRKRSSKQV